MYDGKKTCLPRVAPSQKRVSEVSLQRFERGLERSSARLRGYVLLRDGAVVAEKYWAPYTAGDVVWVNSISKSFASTAIGLAVQEGLLAVTDPVLSFFPAQAPADASENLQAMQVQHLLSMTTGHDKDTVGHLMEEPDGDWCDIFLRQPVTHTPGTHFVYNSGASFMLAAILQVVAGQTLAEYLQPRLFQPLGFGPVYWDSNNQGISTGGWGIMVQLEDLAKLGQLYLDKGRYDGRQILPPEWVGAATTIQADNADNENQDPDWTQGYGYQFWRCRHNAYRGDGAMGQYCVVMPDQNAVLALMSDTEDMQEILDILWRDLLPGLLPKTSATQEKALNSTWQLEENEFGIQRVSFATEGELLNIAVALRDNTTHTLRAGHGNWADNSIPMPFGTPTWIKAYSVHEQVQPVSCYYEWIGDTTLSIEWLYRNTPHKDTMVCNFGSPKALFKIPSKNTTLFQQKPPVDVEGTKI